METRVQYYDIEAEDTQCFVNCECGEKLSVADYQIEKCPKCGTGYITEFRCYKVENYNV